MTGNKSLSTSISIAKMIYLVLNGKAKDTNVLYVLWNTCIYVGHCNTCYQQTDDVNYEWVPTEKCICQPVIISQLKDHCNNTERRVQLFFVNMHLGSVRGTVCNTIRIISTTVMYFRAVEKQQYFLCLWSNVRVMFLACSSCLLYIIASKNKTVKFAIANYLIPM